jgi:hypothetical protein
MLLKVLLFTIIQLIPIIIWFFYLKRKGSVVDFRLMLSYFLCGSWFGMFGELFLFQFIDWIFHSPIWEYRVMPIHNKITSSYGPIMWGLSAVYICLHFHSQDKSKKRNVLVDFALEAGFLLVLEILFNFTAYAIFNNYYFYYFVPDLFHWSSFSNMPFWWVGYKMMVKYAQVMYKQEKLNIGLAIMMIVVAFAYQ